MKASHNAPPPLKLQISNFHIFDSPKQSPETDHIKLDTCAVSSSTSSAESSPGCVTVRPKGWRWDAREGKEVEGGEEVEEEEVDYVAGKEDARCGS